MSADPALAALCEATEEDVEVLLRTAGVGWAGVCPLCGKPAEEHPLRAAGKEDT